MKRDALRALFDEWLEPGRFNDAAENGLQVEGKPEISRIVTGVSANRTLIERAVALGADAVVVHHGLVWGGGIRRIDGWLKERIALLLQHGISLFAYHLPLDAHKTLGNNAGLAEALGVIDDERAPFGRYKGTPIGWSGPLKNAVAFEHFVAHARLHVGNPLAAFGDLTRPVRTVGVCSGGAPELLHEAISERLDVYVTGEVTEWVKSVSEESGTAFVALGHHRTERFGAMRLASALSSLAIETTFVDVENPA
jgi:dinuclear metal center YbgI/SA1388 family protein